MFKIPNALVIVLSFTLVAQSFAQSVASRQKKVDYSSNSAKLFILVFNVGVEVANNNDLNKWLSSYNVVSTDRLEYAFGLKGLFPASGKFLIGFEFRDSFSGKPKRSDNDIELLIGKSIKLKWHSAYVLPIIGLGGNSGEIKFNDSIPAPLAKLNRPKASLIENTVTVNPRLMMIKHLANSGVLPYTIGFEIGCKIYPYRSVWYYDGNVSGIPNSSIYHPYFSVLLGFGGVKKR